MMISGGGVAQGHATMEQGTEAAKDECRWGLFTGETRLPSEAESFQNEKPRGVPPLPFSSKFLIKSLGKSLASNAEPIKEVSDLPVSSASSHDWKTSSLCEISREHTAVSSVTAPVTSWVIYTADGGGEKKNPAL